MPKRYTAEAFIREGLAAKAASDSAARPVQQAASGRSPLTRRCWSRRGRSCSSRISWRARLSRAWGLSVSARSWAGAPFNLVAAEFYGDATSAPEYQVDMAATKLMRACRSRRSRGCIRSCCATAPRTPNLPPRDQCIRGGVPAQTTLQKLSGQRAAAQTALSESLATLGDKHPKVREARMRLASVEALIKEQPRQERRMTF